MNNLQKLQEWLEKNNIDVFIISRTDEFLSEYLAPYAERLEWVSNFSGSAGKAIVMQNIAGIFVDGRYTIQAQKQVDKNFFAIKSIAEYDEWLEKNIKKNITIGIDPKLHSKIEIENIKKIADNFSAQIKFLEVNPIDLLWCDQPLFPKSKAFIHHLKYSGRSAQEKISQIRSILQSNDCEYYILTALDSIAWLLNLRGKDILYTPLNLAYTIITPNNKIELFIGKDKIQNIKFELEPYANFHSLKDIEDFIKKISPKSTIGLDKRKTPYFFEKICTETLLSFKYQEDPCLYLKAQKNKIELEGARNANLRDGVSVTKFCYWLKNKMIFAETDEILAAKKLLSLREKNELYYSLSFDAISAVGEHSALPHYRVTKDTNLAFDDNTIYLVDSGAQYLDGTTDITRTVIIGKPSNQQKDRFTRVLKGHIAVANCTFKEGTKGSALDFLARKSLQEIGCDYQHGTGHGIGSFLNVHEGPQVISKISNNSWCEGFLYEGMILSNEPGYYQEGKYGIRTENLIVVRKNSNENLFFETISWAPIDIDLIERKLLNLEEINWLNNYHKQVFQKLKSKLDHNERQWLEKITQPLN